MTLQINVWDEGLISNDLIGRVVIPLEELSNQMLNEKWHLLQNPKNPAQKNEGQLLLSSLFRYRQLLHCETYPDGESEMLHSAEDSSHAHSSHGVVSEPESADHMRAVSPASTGFTKYHIYYKFLFTQLMLQRALLSSLQPLDDWGQWLCSEFGARFGIRPSYQHLVRVGMYVQHLSISVSHLQQLREAIERFLEEAPTCSLLEVGFIVFALLAHG